MINKKNNIPFNLQFFAQEVSADGQTGTDGQTGAESQAAPEGQPEGTESGETGEQDNGTNTEKLLAEIARMKVNEQKAKRELDKALREKAEAKNALRAKQTAEEIEDEAKREEKEAHDAEFSRLQEFERKTLAKDRYLMQGMPAEMAEKAAVAEVSGDMDALSEIQRQHYEEKLKVARADWQKSIPQPQFGVNEYSSMTKEEIMKIKDPDERVMAIAKNKHLFK